MKRKLLFFSALLFVLLFVKGSLGGHVLTSYQLIPTTVPNCIFWVRSDLGITKDGSNLVSSWADQSGQGNDVTQGTAVKKPVWTAAQVNGFPALIFDGVIADPPTCDELTRTSFTGGDPNQPFTLVAVVQGTQSWTGLEYRMAVDSNGAKRALIYLGVGALTNTWGMFAGGAEQNTNIANNPAVYHLVINIYNGAASYSYIDNSAAIGPFNPGADALNGIGIGANNLGFAGWEGGIAEAVIYAKALNSSEVNFLKTYFNRRYALY